MSTENITLQSVAEDLAKLNSTKFNEFGGEYNDNNVLDFAAGRRALYLGHGWSKLSDRQKKQTDIVLNYCIAKGFSVDNLMFENSQQGSFLLKNDGAAHISNCITLDQAIEIIEKDIAKL